MNLEEIKKVVRDKLEIRSGDRAFDNLLVQSINQAYREIAEKSPIVTEYDYYVTTKVLEVPEDFLVTISLVHSVLGYLEENVMYVTAGKSFILADDVLENTGSIHLIYGANPVSLKNDTDVPLINEKYHYALSIFALYVCSSESTTLNKYSNKLPYLIQEYMNILASIRPVSVAKDSINYVHSIRNVTGW